jgi:putative heme transporter
MTITLERGATTGPGSSALVVAPPDGPDTATVAEPVELADGSADGALGRWLTFPVLAVLAWFLFDNRSTIGAGFAGLQAATPGWLVLAAAGGAGLTVAGAVAQAGALSVRVPFATMCTVQLAGSLVNQVLPAGTGSMAVNMRFLRRQGLTRSSAAAALGLNQIVGVVVHVLLLAAVLVVEPASVTLPHPSAETIAIATLAAVLVALVVAAARRGPRAPGPVGPAVRLRGEASQICAVMRDPARAAALWLGSLATPLLQAAVLYAVARSVGVELAPWHIGAVYLAASALAALVPTPGGLGALDLTIAATLIGSGVPATTAATTTVAFRLMTAWLPLLPAGLALVVLSRRRLI